MSVMSLRPATMGDAETLFNWRNDPETQANSLSTDPVPWDDHCNWLKASLANPDRDLLIAEIDGVPVGTVRIDRGEESELSWTVAPDQRGKGIAKQMVALACPPEAVARIKPDNIASQRIAEAAGFKQTFQIWERHGSSGNHRPDRSYPGT